MTLSSRFRGALVAGLIGDCYGAVFEYEKRATHKVLNAFFNKRAEAKFKAPYLHYTDDTALTVCVAESLVAKQAFDDKDLANRFVKKYFSDPNRGYGGSVKDLFVALRATKFEDVFGSAQRQFSGSGSYGNGGAMRVSPVPLFSYHKDEAFAIDLAKKTALVTHANRLGYNGAILQTLAIYKSLKSSKPLNADDYIEYLTGHMKAVEKFSDQEIIDEGQEEFCFTKALKNVKELLEYGETCPDKIDIILGTDVSAHRSVPTAIYVFLRAMTPIEGIETDNPIQRTVHFALSLGGDTDTIATMAGSIAGAFYGIELVPTYLQKHCELLEETIESADKLLEAAESVK